MSGPLTADRVRERSTSTGTGSFALDGPQPGFQGFGAGIGDGNSCRYMITDGLDWEVGIGTFNAPNQLTRTTVLASSAAGALVDFPDGVKEVICTEPAFELANRYCKVVLGAPVNLASATPLVVSWSAEIEDQYDLFDAGSDPTRILLDLSGKYLVMAGGLWAAGTQGARKLEILKNVSDVLARDVRGDDGTEAVAHSLSTIVRLNAGDEIKLRIEHQEGANLDFGDGSDGVEESVAYLLIDRLGG